MMDWRALMSGATARQVNTGLSSESYDQYDHNDQNQASSGSFGHIGHIGHGGVAQPPVSEPANPAIAEIADRHGLTLSELQQAAGPDWCDVEANIKLADALADAVKTRRMRERGQVPPNYTSVTVCAGCGPVPVWPDCPEHVLACPWCFNRAAGKPIPTPDSRSEQREATYD